MLQDEQQSQCDEQLVIRLFLEKEKKNEQQQKIRFVNTLERQLVENVLEKLRGFPAYRRRGRAILRRFGRRCVSTCRGRGGRRFSAWKILHGHAGVNTVIVAKITVIHRASPLR